MNVAFLSFQKLRKIVACMSHKMTSVFKILQNKQILRLELAAFIQFMDFAPVNMKCKQLLWGFH